jgi:hypothetical protein
MALLEQYSSGVYSYFMITVAETRMFQRNVPRLLFDHEREDLVTYIAELPNAGVIMEGTGGIRKFRWA